MKAMEMTPGQQKLYEKGRDYMAAQIPGWDDAHPADPALMVLELGALLGEAQEEVFGEIDQRGYAAFLKLLGGVPHTLRPARLLALPEPGAARPRKGERFWLSGLPFEAADVGRDAGGKLEISVQEENGLWRRWDEDTPLEVSDEWTLRLTFSSELPAGERLRLWCGVVPEPGRTPPDAFRPYPVRLAGYLFEEGGFAIRDGTRGLLRSGFLSFVLDRPARELRIHAEGELEGIPRLSALALEPVRLVQRRTRSAAAELTPPFRLPAGWQEGWTLRFFTPAGGGGWREAEGLAAGVDGLVTGWHGDAPHTLRVTAAEPDFHALHPLEGIAEERVHLREQGVLPESLGVMVEEDGTWYDCPVRAPDPKRTLPRGCRWDAGAAELCFGDGRDFRVPQPGRLLVVSCALCLGEAGNGAGGKLFPDGAPEGAGAALCALGPSWGGRDDEAPRDAFFRLAGSWRGRRAAALADYEELAWQTPGLALGKVRAAAGRGAAGVDLLVMPRGTGELPQLTAWQRQRLLGWMERHRMVGVPVRVRGPEYVPVDVSAVICATGRVDQAALREAVAELTDGVTGLLDFGAQISYAAVFAALERTANVQMVETLTLNVRATGVQRDQEGGVQLAPAMLPYLDTFDVKFR